MRPVRWPRIVVKRFETARTIRSVCVFASSRNRLCTLATAKSNEPSTNKSRYADHLDFLVHGIGLVSHKSPRLTNITRDPYGPEDGRRPLESSMVLSVETTLQHPRRGLIKLVAMTEIGHDVY